MDELGAGRRERTTFQKEAGRKTVTEEFCQRWLSGLTAFCWWYQLHE